MEQQYQSTDVPPKDKPKIAELLGFAPPYEAMDIKLALANPSDTGWWYGTYLNEKLDAIAYMNDRAVHLFAKDTVSMNHLGMSLARSQGKRSSGETHSAFGAEDLVSAFWQGFKSAGRTLVGDFKLQLLRLTSLAAKTNDAYAVRYANAKDLLLVADFLGEELIDVIGIDLRRHAKEAHEKNCAQLIAENTILIGSQRGKAAFIAKTNVGEESIFLEHIFFPIAMRRPKVMAGILAQTSALLLKNGKELLAYVDGSKSELFSAFLELGYENLRTCRLIRMR